MAGPIDVPTLIVAVLHLENLFQDPQIVGDVEGIPGIFIAEEIVKIIEPGPRNGG